MKDLKYLGIWMDHSVAHLIDLDAPIPHRSIRSKFTAHVREEVLHKGENHMHHKEQQMHEAYYKDLSQAILPYNRVLLFGPTDAKKELHNFLNHDLHFKDIAIEVESADKMTDPEKTAFVKKHFQI
jgi:hypothetical protein